MVFIDISNMNVGDKFGISYRNGVQIVEVARVTATQIVTKSDIRLSKKTGRVVGGSSYDPGNAISADEAREAVAEMKAKILGMKIKVVSGEVKKLFRIDDAEVPATLRHIANILERLPPKS